MTKNTQLINQFNHIMDEIPLVAILRGITDKDICQVADILMESGFKMIEVPLNSPNPFKTIELLRKHCPAEILVGAGTVLDVDSVKKLNDIGAELIVTPNLDNDVLTAINQYDNFISLIGCFSPSECFSAIKQGANAVKIFPANSLGAGYIKDIKSVLPKQTKVLAVGGIAVYNMHNYTKVNVDGFGLGGSLYTPDQSMDQIKKNAVDFITTFNQIKG